jgi:sialidase-1
VKKCDTVPIAEIMKLTAHNIEHGVVAARPDQMYGWPGITRTADGDIVVSASERIYHTGPQSRTVVMRSADGGRTWTLPQEVYNSETDDRDASLRTMPDGTIVLTSFSSTDWVPHVVSGEFCAGRIVPERWLSQWQGIVERMGLTEEGLPRPWLMRSEDGGRTWGPPVDTPTGQHSGPAALADGRLIYIGTGLVEMAEPIVAWESSDQGDTWETVGEIPRAADLPEETWLIENHLVETSPGRLVALFRAEGCPWEDQYMYQSNSNDFGRNWSVAEKLPVWGYPPHLLKLSSGAILCSYSYRDRPPSIRAMISYDEGATWDYENMMTLHDLPVEHDFGYPVTTELAPGEMVTVWYLNRKYVRENDKYVHLAYAEDAGGIMSIHWTLK